MTHSIDKQITFHEQMADLQSKLDKLLFNITGVEQHLSANPEHRPTLSRYNLLCHNRSEVLTKIRKLKERMGGG